MAVLKKTEFEIPCPHRVGELACALETLAQAGANVLAFCGYGHNDKAMIMIVVDDEAKAKSALKGAGIKFQSHPVVAVMGRSGPGEGGRLARALADAKVNIEYTYASTSGAGESTAIFAVKNVRKALKVLA
ncbi:MAG: hypothetical protein HYY17_16490 [Planctomycetes bacterium]|nr:hypothetical protein [Planctomycetota bacterium]